MRVLVVIFGGLDHQFLDKWNCTNLRMEEWGPVVVDELWNQRDVATPITAQLITGKTWRENGIADRKKRIVVYRSEFVRWIEERLFRHLNYKRIGRQKLYEAFGKLRIDTHNFTGEDLKCKCLFDVIEGSRAVYVPAYNPEPSWALGRNILDPRQYTAFGVPGALDLLEKNFQWRKQKFMNALEGEPCQMLMGQFQYIDSTQHLYISYHDETQMDKIEAAYWRMDEFAGEIREKAAGKYDRVLFLSDNGAARKICYKPTHENRPYYAVDTKLDIKENNLRDFFNHIISWVKTEPHVGVVDE